MSLFIAGQDEPGSGYEEILRKLYNGITELGFYTKAELKLAMKQIKEEPTSATINRLLALQAGILEHKQ